MIPPKITPRTSTCHTPKKGPFQNERQTSSNQHFEEQAVSFRLSQTLGPQIPPAIFSANVTRSGKYRRTPKRIWIFPASAKLGMSPVGGTVGQNLQAFCGDSEVYLGLAPLSRIAILTTRMTLYRIGDYERNSHLPLLLGRGTTQCIYTLNLQLQFRILLIPPLAKIYEGIANTMSRQLNYHQEFQVPKMLVLNLIKLFGWWFSLA